jgi:uncharacterized membrane protein
LNHINKILSVLKHYAESYGLYFVLIAGTLIRLRQYLTFRSYWLDESFLVINLRDKSFGQLLGALDNNQVAPIGFLYIEKSMLELFGPLEWALRLFPFIAAVLSIYLVYNIANHLLNKILALAASFMFILPTGITYYASEVKQYSLDLFLTLLLITLYLNYYQQKSKNNIFLLVVIGSLSVWFSNIAIIVLFSLGLTEAIKWLVNKKISRIWLLVAGVWILSFSIYYLLFIHNHPNQAGMERYWARYFVPVSADTLNWIWYSLKYYFSDAYSLNFAVSHSWIIIVLIALGTLKFILKNRIDALVLVIPIITHLVLSALGLYPFVGRLILYQAPFYIILILAGLNSFSKIKPLGQLAVLALFIHLEFKPITGSVSNFINPNYREHIKPVMAYINEESVPGDAIYVYAGSKVPFEVYQDKFIKKDLKIIFGSKSVVDFKKFERQYLHLNGRTWLIFSHRYPTDGIEYILKDIYSKNILDEYSGFGSETFLVEYP